jgi:hypothetical protein
MGFYRLHGSIDKGLYPLNVSIGSTPRSIAAVFPVLPLLDAPPPPSTPAAHAAGDDPSPVPTGGGGGAAEEMDVCDAGGGGRGKAQWGRKEGSLDAGGGGDVVRLVNVAPTWNAAVQSYTLNFYSRVKVRARPSYDCGVRPAVHGSAGPGHAQLPPARRGARERRVEGEWRQGIHKEYLAKDYMVKEYMVIENVVK